MVDKKLLFVFALLLSALHTAHATVIVGSCMSGNHALASANHSFSTINQAIAAAHPGETVSICPGTYAEQLTITKPLTLVGMTTQQGVTLVAPAAGLKPLPAGSQSYPQIYVYRAGNVAINNIAVNGANANIVYSSITFDVNTACQVGFMKDFPGIYFSETAGNVQDSSVSAHFANSGTPDSPQTFPNCGTGIEFANHGQEGRVADTVINNYGYTGISSTGPVWVVRNVLTGSSGPYQVGISVPARGSVVRGNTVSGLQFIQTTGILGGETVDDNIVTGWIEGISKSKLVRHNTLVNNAVGLTEPEVAEQNLITAPATYNDPTCSVSQCAPGTAAKASIGIDMQCMDSSLVRGNDMVGLGVGIAELKSNDSASSSNLYAEVKKASTSCTSNPAKGKN